MSEISMAQNIAAYRRHLGLTQEQLAEVLHLSPQAVSKWETGASQPDTAMLPLLAETLHVTIDGLFYGPAGDDGDLFEWCFRAVRSLPQMSEDSYRTAWRLFAYAHRGISCGNLRGQTPIEEGTEPVHITGEGGVSVFSGKGFGAILTRDFFRQLTPDMVDLSQRLFGVLGQPNTFAVVLAILSMSDISFDELSEKLSLDKDALQTALDTLRNGEVIVEKLSKHKVLGKTYDIREEYHTVLSLLVGLMQVEQDSLCGLSCCMGYGDYPIQFGEK